MSLHPVKSAHRAAGADFGFGVVCRRLQFVTARENSLFIFHALGKVLYSKRSLLSFCLSSGSVSPLFGADLPIEQDGESMKMMIRRTQKD